MMENKINQQIEDAMGSLDHTQRAEPRPYLYTRIVARMEREADNGWERAGRFMTRPVVALATLCILAFVNVLAIRTVWQNNNAGTEQASTVSSDDYTGTVASIYDIENVEP